MFDESLFKSYDVRGLYGTYLTEAVARRIGRAFAQYLSAKTIAVGRDMRISSPSLCAAFVEGVCESGTNVLDLGLVTTPMLYYASATLPVDGAAMVTASHNPWQYNGMKFCRAHAVPIGARSGLSDIKALALATDAPAPAQTCGSVTPNNIASAFHVATKKYATFDSVPFVIVVDTANAMGALDLPLWRSFSNLTIETLYEELDGSFPHHEANPLNAEALTALQKTVREKNAHLGIAYDGDGDRIGFVDETGTPVPGDLVLALLARKMLADTPGRTVIYDVRSSRAVKEIITEAGGIPIESAVGHSNIKALMREHNALLAGETSMHYYFSDFSYAENSTLAAVMLLNLMRETGATLSELISQVRRYHHSGEINFTTANADALLARLKDTRANGSVNEIDGLKISYPHWWFSVRASNTEPVVRLNIEADSVELLQQKRAELTAFFTAS